MASADRTSTSNEPAPRRAGTDDPGGKAVVEDTMPAASAAASLPAGEARAPVRPTIPLDRYRIGKELGRGGMGRVVEAFDVQLGRTVALKEVLAQASTGTHRRFAREIHITARLEHPSIVPLYDSGITSEGKPFYVMRKVSGQPLDELIARARDLDDRLTLLPAVLAALDAVAHAHKRGVIHRDLKPANILVGEHGETVVIDWGLAKVVGEADEPRAGGDAPPSDSLHTQIGSVFGTPGFMAPEQARGEALDLEGDVYALGAVLYQLLAGAPPVAGNSATEVMDKTRTHDIRPLAETAPGAPPELVAIVGKALAFDAADRYPDAGALAEDVRRFLAGQLVAAHDYTTRQRLVRFARRHRGALSVAALATAAVAAMAWIGVHRITSERDAANLARHEADERAREVEAAHDRLADRHDALVVAQARALVETSPTEAIGYLKQLSAKSPRIDEARAIAQAAAVRGVAWGLQSTSVPTTIAALDPDGRQLVQVSRDGMVRVFDLDRRVLVQMRAFAPETRAAWVLGGKLLVTHPEAEPQLFDPATNTLEPLALPPISFVVTTATGDRALVELAEPKGALRIYDAATRTLAPLAFPEKVAHYELAPDGSWIAVSSSNLVVIYDRDGKELTRRAGQVLRIVGSRVRKIAVMVDLNRIAQCVLDPAPAWTELALPHPVLDFVYRGPQLVGYLGNQDVAVLGAHGPYRLAHVDGLTFAMMAAADRTVVVPAGDGKLYWVNELGRGALILPTTPKAIRVAARPESPRVAVVGDGVVFVYDLRAVVPRRFDAPVGTQAWFVDDDTLLVKHPDAPKLRWLDVVTGAYVPIDHQAVMPRVLGVDPGSGRVLIADHDPAGIRIDLLRRGSRATELVVANDDRYLWARLVPGDAVIFGTGGAEISAKLGRAPAKQVATLDGKVLSTVGVGHLAFAAQSATGQVVRVDLATGKRAQTRVALGATGFLASDERGRVLIVTDNRIQVWDQQVTGIAQLDKKIERLDPISGGVAVVLPDRETYVLELAPGATPRRVIPSTPVPPAVSGDGRLLAAIGTSRTVALVELPSGARWNLPAIATASLPWIGVSPTTRRVLQHVPSGLAVWQLPHVPSDLTGWLDAQTNAQLDAQGVIAWPWQLRRAP